MATRRREWCVEFWDFGEWNEWADTRSTQRNAVIETAQRMNREMKHEDRVGAFQGHRFRVRRVKP